MNLTKLLKQVHTVCFESNKGGLPFGPYRQVVTVKSMNNYSNNNPHDPHGFKEDVKIKYDTVKVVVEKFPNGIGAMVELLGAAVPSIHLARYCQLTPVEQLVWKKSGDDLTKPMLFLMTLKNDNAKKDLRLAYSQENTTVHLPTIKAMARYQSTQYSNKNSAHQRKNRKGG